MQILMKKYITSLLGFGKTRMTDMMQENGEHWLTCYFLFKLALTILVTDELEICIIFSLFQETSSSEVPLNFLFILFPISFLMQMSGNSFEIERNNVIQFSRQLSDREVSPFDGLSQSAVIIINLKKNWYFLMF